MENNDQTLELWYRVLRMREAGATVTFVGTGSDERSTRLLSGDHLGDALTHVIHALGFIASF